MRLFILSISVLLMSFSCVSKKDSSSTSTAEITNAFGVSDSTIVAKLRTTGCFGRCPTYELTVFANGNCTYNAKQYTKLEVGLYSTQIDSSIVNELHRIGERIGFKNYKDVYTNPYIQDKPSVFLSLYIPDHNSLKMVERVIDYPQEIWDLENALKAINETSDWKMISETQR